MILLRIVYVDGCLMVRRKTYLMGAGEVAEGERSYE
jgi:hypothetical protein